MKEMMTDSGTTDRLKIAPDSAGQRFRAQLQCLSDQWKNNGLPSALELDRVANQLEADKKKGGIQGIWRQKPMMVTATIDDGLGQGLNIIHRYAAVLGLKIHPLGLMQPPEKIIEACLHHRPRFLGMTVLQLDSDDDIARISRQLPPETTLIAGGPVFKFDTDMAARCGIHFVAANVACFIDFICGLVEKNGTK
jgi:methylmalonyl-CoA mutase cobalamin-binding subunit